jgi:hypothetical protein
MDPYLEDPRLWPTFQHQFVGCLYQVLLPSLIDRYVATIARRQYPTPESAEDHSEDFVEIRERASGRLITLMDMVSPANKTTPEGRRVYLDKRGEATAEGASVVEVDLVVQGRPTLEYCRDGLPRWHYAVTVTRATQSERFEIYTATLQRRLPRFRLPLAGDDRDTVLDLQAVFTRCYEQGGFASMVNYKRLPPVPLDQDDIRFVSELLGLEQPFGTSLAGYDFPHEQIAAIAYDIWLKEGCPHGCDVEHWQQAIEQLRLKGL